MTDDLTCAAARDLAPDLALGLLPGAERARLLAHLAGCSSCEALVAELAEVADNLLLLAPGADPPPGFESAVLARIDGASSSAPVVPIHPASAGRSEPAGRHRRWVVLLAVAAALVLLGGLAGGIALADRESGYPPVRQFEGASLRSAPLVGSNQHQWGQVFLFNGKTSWVMVTMRWDVPDGTFNLVVDRRTGSPEWLTKLHLAGGEGSIGTTLVDAPEVTAVQVFDAQGHLVCEAHFA